MEINYKNLSRQGLSVQIADAIREAILEGRLLVDARLPSETELANRFDVSRATVREALKRLAAQDLIRTQRGPAGGAFVNRLSPDEARASLVTTSRLLIGMNGISFEAAAEARYSLEHGCLDMAAKNRDFHHLETMAREVAIQRGEGLSDEDFCASDVRFHQAVAEATGNPMLAYQVGGAVEAMQPLMNMLTYRMRDRTVIAKQHEAMMQALDKQDPAAAALALDALASYTLELADARRKTRPQE